VVTALISGRFGLAAAALAALSSLVVDVYLY
jgi:hypothetical protein